MSSKNSNNTNDDVTGTGEESYLFSEDTVVTVSSIKDSPFINTNNDISTTAVATKTIEGNTLLHNQHHGNGHNRRPDRKSGIFGAQLNMSNTIVGAGIVGLPYAYMQCGFVIGIVLTIAVGCITVKSCNILINLASFNPLLKNKEVKTYEDLLYYPFGEYGRGFILLFMFILSYGCMIAYLIIIKDTLPLVLGYAKDDDSNGPEIILIIISAGIVLPISMQRDISSLEKTSIISLVCDVILIIFIATRSPITETIQEYGGFAQVFWDYAFNFDRLFIGLGIISTAMGCQQCVFMIYGSLENPTRRRFWLVSVIALSLSTTLSVLIGVCGSLAFMEDTKGNILNNYHNDSTEANMARFLLAVTMIFTYPMESIIVRHVIVGLLYNGDIDGSHPPRITDEYDGSRRAYCMNRREKVTLIIYIMALLPALAFDDTGIVLSLTGSIAGSVLAYVAPGLAFLGVNGHAFLELCCRLLGYYKEKESTYTDNNELQSTNDHDHDNNKSIELPMIGNSNLKLNPNGPTSSIDYYNCINSTCCKPIWWYCFGFPLWSTIAFIGSEGMKKRLDKDGNTTVTSSNISISASSSVDGDNNVDNDAPTNIRNAALMSSSASIKYEHDDNDDDDDENDTNDVDIDNNDYDMPSTKDFIIAILLIMFGIIAFVLGIAENIHKVLVGRDNPDLDTEFNG